MSGEHQQSLPDEVLVGWSPPPALLDGAGRALEQGLELAGGSGPPGRRTAQQGPPGGGTPAPCPTASSTWSR